MNKMQVVAVASLPKEIAAGLQPKQNNSIRGLLLQSGWVVEKLENDSCTVTYIAQVSSKSLSNNLQNKKKKKKRFRMQIVDHQVWVFTTFL